MNVFLIIQRPVPHIVIINFTDGMDFHESIESIQFDEEGQQCIDVTIKMDEIVENREEIVVVLRSMNEDVIFSRSSAVIAIKDDDGISKN